MNSAARTSHIEITDEIRRAYEDRDRRLDNDPDIPTKAPEFLAAGVIGKCYRPISG